jgi:phage protein D
MGTAASPNVEIYVAGKRAADSNFLGYTVDRDMHQPDMASVVLSNQGDLYTASVKLGDRLEVKVGDGSTPVFIGEIVGVEPVYKGGEKSRVAIRAMNKLHRLSRVRKSLTYMDKTDQQMLSHVVSEYGLSLDWKHEKSITYKHVYQHNQTDLEFLRTRAARMGCHLWCVGTTVHCKQPDLQSSPIATLRVDESSPQGALRSFSPRISIANIVKKVTVKGWHPEKKELIVGEAHATSSPLGKEHAIVGAGDLAGEETFTVDHPIWSKEEAEVLAHARLLDASMSYITGEAEVTGDPVFDLGKVVKIIPNSDPESTPTEDPFNGKHYIMGVTHRHTASKSKDSGYVTILRLARNAQKGV